MTDAGEVKGVPRADVGLNSKEELRRLFQISCRLHADELPTKAGIDALDKLWFRDFLRDVYKREFPSDPVELTRLLKKTS